jgi:hypothetical protein
MLFDRLDSDSFGFECILHPVFSSKNGLQAHWGGVVAKASFSTRIDTGERAESADHSIADCLYIFDNLTVQKE